MLFRELDQSGINFEYEKSLKVKKLVNDDFIEIKPDFTIKLGKKKLFLEHLGMLSDKKYSQEFTQLKRPTYEKNGLSDDLITTDDSNGVKTEKILELIRDLKTNKLKKTPDSKFSEHHYELY